MAVVAVLVFGNDCTKLEHFFPKHFHYIYNKTCPRSDKDSDQKHMGSESLHIPFLFVLLEFDPENVMILSSKCDNLAEHFTHFFPTCGI